MVERGHDVNAPDERAFQADVAKPAFRLGQARGRWQLERVTWPSVLISVTANDGRHFGFRFECSGYPQTPPTSSLWDLGRNERLAPRQWPIGLSSGGRVSAVFRRNWEHGAALYLPCDRSTHSAHPEWVHGHPTMSWKPSDGIVHYLELVHELLNCPDYLPPGCTES